MEEVKAKFDCVGKFIDREGLDQNVKRAHYVFGTKDDIILGGLYLDTNFPFPVDGILITLNKG